MTCNDDDGYRCITTLSLSFICAAVYVHTCAYICLHMYMRRFIYIYIYIHVCMYVCMYVYIYIERERERERERHACSSSSHGRKGGAPKDPGLHAAAVSAGAGRLQVRLRVKSCPDLLCQTGSSDSYNQGLGRLFRIRIESTIGPVCTRSCGCHASELSLTCRGKGSEVLSSSLE